MEYVFFEIKEHSDGTFSIIAKIRTPRSLSESIYQHPALEKLSLCEAVFHLSEIIKKGPTPASEIVKDWVLLAK